MEPGQGGPRPVAFHPQAAKELAKLDKPVQRQIHQVIEGLSNDDPGVLAQTHALAGGSPLDGWYSTKASRGHRIVHQPDGEGGIHIGYVGLHDYDKAIRRLTSLDDEHIGEHHYDVDDGEYKGLWDRWHPKLQPEIHRHLAMSFPADHPVWNPRASDEEKAHAILHQASQGAYQTGGLGWHWTDDPSLDFLKSGGGRLGFGEHPVVIHAKTPPREHIEDNGWTLVDDRAVKDWDSHEEREVPLKRNAPVHVTGVSWPVGGGKMHRHDFTEPIVKRAGREPYEFEYARNTVPAPRMPGGMYGQDIEPHGRYMTVRARPGNYIDNEHMQWEFGTQRFENPLHLPAEGWKERLSEMHGGKTGRELSQAVRDAGHDGIVTHETWRGKTTPGEIVDLTGFQPRTAAIDPYTGWPPHQRAVSEAQEVVRREYPMLTRPLPDDPDQRDEELRKVLREGDHPDAEDAFVHVHSDPNRPSSHPMMDRSTLAVGVGLHQSRADYGTLYHEAAHLLHMQQTGRRQNEPAPDEIVHGPAFMAHYARLVDPYGRNRTPGGNYKPGAGNLLLNEYYRSLDRSRKTGKLAARPMPTSRIFGPTYGLDHRLFIGDLLRPQVRAAVLERLDQVLRVDGGLVGSEWQDYVEVYLAGSEASEWTGPNLEGNDDFDTLLGIDYDGLREHDGRGASAEWVDKTDTEIDDIFNDVLRHLYNDENWHAPFGGVWHLTGYVNGDAYDIRDIKPYAAYDLNKDVWAVRPPHLPSWSPESFPEGPALWKQTEAYADEIEAILGLPEPYRTQQGAALYDFLHDLRHREFTQTGHGWYGPGNVIEKYLDQLGLWAKLVHLKHNEQHGTFDDGEQPMLEAVAAKNTGPLNLVRGFPVEPEEGWHPEVADRIMKGQAKAEDLVPHIDKDHVGVWWYHPDDGDVEDAKYHATGSDETLEKNHSAGETWPDDPDPDLPMIKNKKGHYQGEVAVALEAHHPGGWNPNTDNPVHPLMGNSYLPDHTKLKLHTIHYSPDWGETWHKVHVNPPVDLYTNGPGKTAVFKPGPSVHPLDYILASSDGDDWTVCDQGHEHWGTNGAAGLLIRHKDPEDGQTRYLLQKRSPWVDHPDTWGIPGGALGHDEHPLWGAFREGIEELGTLPPGIRRSHTVTDDHGGWAYHTTVADVPERFEPHGGEDDHESDGHGWFTSAEMKDLPLHPGFAKSWDRVRTSHPGNSTVHGSRRTAADEDYRMQHRPADEEGAPHHDITANGVYPSDVMTHPEWYNPAHEESFWHSFDQIRRTQGKPEAKVRIYRALPAEHAHKGFSTGDWVTTSKEYARTHGMQEDSKHDWPVISTVVPAKHLHTDGNDMREWGYTGPSTPSDRVAYKGGYHQEISQRADGSIGRVQRKAKPDPNAEMWGHSVVKMSPEDYRKATDFGDQREIAQHVLSHVKDVQWLPKGSEGAHGHTVDDPSDSWHAEQLNQAALNAHHPEGGHEPGTAPLLGVTLHTKNGKTVDRIGLRPHLDYSDLPMGFANGHEPRWLGRAVKHPSLGQGKTAAAEGLEFRTRSGKRSGRSHTTISAHDGGQRVGHVRMTEGGTEVDDLHVNPSRRGEGIGHALMDQAIGQFGHNTLRLHASPFGKDGLDQDALMGFYASHGFEPEADRGRGYMVRRPTAHEAVRRTAVDATGSMMVAFVPPQHVIDHLVQEDGERADEIHITLLYLGKESKFTPKQIEALPGLVAQWAKTQRPLQARTSGAGTFVNEGNHVLWASVDIKEITRVHDSLVDFLRGHGLPITEDFGYQPHITLKYDKYHVRFLPKITPMTWEISEVWFCRNTDWKSYKLGR